MNQEAWSQVSVAMETVKSGICLLWLPLPRARAPSALPLHATARLVHINRSETFTLFTHSTQVYGRQWRSNIICETQIINNFNLIKNLSNFNELFEFKF